MIFPSLLLLIAAIEPQAPVVAGQEVTLVVTRDGEPAAGVSLRQTRWPGLPDAAVGPIGTTDRDGRVAWTPLASGLTLLEGGEQSAIAAVQPRAPGAGYALLLAVAGALVAGLLVLARREWRSP